MTFRVAVVGGGIAGLCTAFDLQRAGCDVAVYEASDRFGGKVVTSLVGDRMVDAGPDTFLARAPEGVKLCQDLGLADELVSPVSPVPAYIHRSGNLLPLPTGTVLGVPTDLDVLRASGLVSEVGVGRAAQDLTRPASPLGDDCSVGWLCRERLGDEVTDRLIDPLLGGINASNIDDLSLMAGFPQLAQAASAGASLIEGLKSVRASVGATLGSAQKNQPVFYGLPGGIARIVDRLVEHITLPKGSLDGLRSAELHVDHPVSDLGSLDADAVVVATPASVTARLLRSDFPIAADLLETVSYSSVSQVTVELPAESVQPAVDASGILFPRVDGFVLTAATWFSTKWSHYQRPGSVLVRLTSGRAGDDRAANMSDDQLVDTLLEELASVLTVTSEPTAVRVQRWPRSFPQYTPGHRHRIDRVRSLLVAAEAENRPVVLAGAAYDGIGLPACIRTGRAAAKKLVDLNLL